MKKKAESLQHGTDSSLSTAALTKILIDTSTSDTVGNPGQGSPNKFLYVDPDEFQPTTTTTTTMAATTKPPTEARRRRRRSARRRGSTTRRRRRRSARRRGTTRRRRRSARPVAQGEAS